jgi:hypothetical protein
MFEPAVVGVAGDMASEGVVGVEGLPPQKPKNGDNRGDGIDFGMLIPLLLG